MSMIDIKNLTFAYDGSYDNIFEDVSFRIDTDWRLGFTGRNGRGKTTFLNLLMGRYDYSGEIIASVAFQYFPFPVSDRELLTQYVVDEITPNYEPWQLRRELSLLNVDEEVLYRPFNTLSSGEQTKVMLAALFLCDNSFLLIDEPTNHLDMHGRELVSRYLCSKNGFILVSHDRVFLDSCIDHVLSINKSNIEVISGDFSTWWENKERRDNFELNENERLKKDIRRLAETAREKAEWSDRVEATKIGEHTFDRGRVGHLAAKMMKRSKTIETRKNRELEEKSQLLKNIERTESLKLHPLHYHSLRLIEAIDLSISYDGKDVCSGVSFTVERGDRIALGGGNGSGKSSIIKLIYGEDIPYNGQLHIGSGVKISYLPQDTSHLSGSLSGYAISHNIDESLFKTILRKLDFSRIQFDKDMADFSGGQKKKVLIAGSLCEQAHIYIWDEPLNFIDVLSRMQIESLLMEFKPTLLFVEHDRAFCDNIATKKILL